MSGVVSQLTQGVALPDMAWARQTFPRPRIDVGEIPGVIAATLGGAGFAERVKPGMSIAITAGSRGVSNVALIIRSIVDFCKNKGALPFVIPAMGSHGGATAEGQLEVLASFGVTENYVGCPIRSSMETVPIGATEDGRQVLIDKHAAGADGIILACRIKPHTCFRGRYESGIMKMMAIGLGKQQGAEVCHNDGFGRMAYNVPLFGRAILKHAKILFALASIENAYDETYRLEGVLSEDIDETEPGLLKDAFDHMPRIMVDECDVLVVDRIGKNYSGDGMDPNITGSCLTPYGSGGIKSKRIAVLGLSEETHGNANGIGMASATTKRLYGQMDFARSYPNAITSKILEGVKLPMVMENDREAIQVCLRSCDGTDPLNPRLVRIHNSLHIEYIQISRALLQEAAATPGLEIITEPTPFAFDNEGNLQAYDGLDFGE